MNPKILLLNGPNLNLLGKREPHLYGSTTLQELVQRLEPLAQAAGVQLSHLQSNHEGVLIDRIHEAKPQNVNFIIINPGGLTHTSVALRDALLGVEIPFIEVHLSNVYAREPFRQHSYLSSIAAGIVCGMGIFGYELALQYALYSIQKNPSGFA
mgnify:CR=1 FL=1